MTDEFVDIPTNPEEFKKLLSSMKSEQLQGLAGRFVTHGKAEDQYKLGCCILDLGRGAYYSHRMDCYRLAARLFRAAAKQDHVHAQYELGKLMCITDYRKYHEAALWFQKAADKGYAPAKVALARLYSEGKGGLEQDDKKANELYLEAANQGNAFAQIVLALRYEEGVGREGQNYEEAGKWFQKAANQRNVFSTDTFGGTFIQAVLAAKSPDSKEVADPSKQNPDDRPIVPQPD